MIEFGVHGSSADSEGVIVIGRCLNGPIEIGSVFSRMRRYVDDEPRGEVEVELEVVGIEAYGRHLDALDSGLTGALRLKGKATDLLGDGWALVG